MCFIEQSKAPPLHLHKMLWHMPSPDYICRCWLYESIFFMIFQYEIGLMANICFEWDVLVCKYEHPIPSRCTIGTMQGRWLNNLQYEHSCELVLGNSVHCSLQLYTAWHNLEHDLLDGIFWLHVRRCKLNTLISNYHLRTCLDHDLTQVYTAWHNLEHDLLDGNFWLHVQRCELNIVVQKTKHGCLFLFPPNCRGLRCEGEQVGSRHEIFQSILM